MPRKWVIVSPPMKPVFYVKPTDAEVAQAMEKKLMDLPQEAGILFAGISIKPDDDGKPVFHIWVGCHKSMDERMIPSLIGMLFQKDIEAGRRVKVEAHRGLGRSFLQRR
jgi:hypothetical protein